MQLHIRGSSNYILEFATGNESLAELKAQVSEREGSEDVLLYVAGKPVDYEMPVSSIGEFHVDVTVPLLGGKVRAKDFFIWRSSASPLLQTKRFFYFI